MACSLASAAPHTITWPVRLATIFSIFLALTTSLSSPETTNPTTCVRR
jgi:hypothetical protein